MSNKKYKNPVSPHAKRRIRERYASECKDDYELSRNALHFGIHAGQLPYESELRGYLLSKMCTKNKIVRMLNGYVYIFSRGRRLITMYPVPEAFMQEADSLTDLQEKNRLQYKQWKENNRMQKSVKHSTI